MTSDNDQSEKGFAGYEEFSATNAAGHGQVATDECVLPVLVTLVDNLCSCL